MIPFDQKSEEEKAAIRAKVADAMQRIENNPLMQSRRGSYRRSGMGQKGGTSANAGRKAVTYTFKFPDGRQGSKRSYQVDQAEAVAMIYQHDGVWYVSAIKETTQDWGRQQSVPAFRRGG